MIHERTFIALKPEAIQRHLIGEMISRFEKRGLKLVAAKLIAPEADLVGQHYPDEDGWYNNLGKKAIEGYQARGVKIDKTPKELGQEVRQNLIDYMKDRPVLAMVWEGAHAVELGRKSVGATNPLDAETGTIRGDYTQESYQLSDNLGRPIQNLIHASGSIEEAKREIELWFEPEEILDYDLVYHQIMQTDGWGRINKKKR